MSSTDAGAAGSEALGAAERRTLLALARDSIAYALAHQQLPTIRVEDHAPPLREVRASFVTLTIGGQLRGCIGSLEAFRPLVLDVSTNACAAAFRDPRFRPLTAGEFPALQVQVSVLSTPAPMSFRDAADLVCQLRPGTDGLIIQLGDRRATYLPTVWQNLPDRQIFFKELKRKAGIGNGEDLAGLKAWRYETECFS